MMPSSLTLPFNIKGRFKEKGGDRRERFEERNSPERKRPKNFRNSERYWDILVSKLFLPAYSLTGKQAALQSVISFC